MAIMGKYCKAYPVDRFEGYAAWQPKPLEPLTEETATEEPGERYYFLQENHTITDGIFLDERIVFDAVTPEWIAYCKDVLGFDPPEQDPDAATSTAASATS